MSYLYSAKSNAFVAAGSVLLDTPEFSDAVEIDAAVFDEFFPYEKDGQRRIAGSDGLPVWEVIPLPTAEEIKEIAIIAAGQKKSQLLADASETIRGWQTDLLLGIISDEDKSKLIAWRIYIKVLEAIDTSLAPDINWPAVPAV
ncbi:hypothetical protein TUM17576_00810 [Enterobacter hormaechei]|nr:tail fiber assembly protein [Enterobacter hormaechei]GJL33261.1 hypothetical protein TUM17576_00810 [Enterobacter hormaechei]